MSEIDLVRSAGEGNRHSMNLLLSENYDILYGFILKLTGDCYLTDDIVQESFVKAIINIKKFKGNGKFSSWLISIGINIYKNHKKKEQRCVQIEMSNMQCNSEDLEAKINMKLEVESALRELQKMDEKKRTEFILKHYYGYTLEEISEITGSKIGSIKSRLHNTIKSLRKVLKEEVTEI